MNHGQVRQREPRLEIPALRKSAKGMPCTIQKEGECNGDEATTVWCHSPFGNDKGMGLKAHDSNGCFGCSGCHAWLDGTRGDERHEIFERAKDRTYYLLFERGKLKVLS
jgi:hypothetical protein